MRAVSCDSYTTDSCQGQVKPEAMAFLDTRLLVIAHRIAMAMKRILVERLVKLLHPLNISRNRWFTAEHATFCCFLLLLLFSFLFLSLINKGNKKTHLG